MVIKHSEEVSLEPVQMDGVKDIKMRLLLSDKDGAPNFVMRLFEVAPGFLCPGRQAHRPPAPSPPLRRDHHE